METIHKYQLHDTINHVAMPRGARVLSVQTQREIPCIWALVDRAHEPETRVFEAHVTGTTQLKGPGYLNYLGTVQVDGGNFVAHVFERLQHCPVCEHPGAGHKPWCRSSGSCSA